MAWSSEENFNSYSDGDLNGGNGGSGWSAAWAGSINFDIQSTTKFDTGKAVINTTNSSVTIDRALTATTSGVVYFTMRIASGAEIATDFINSVNGDLFYVDLSEANGLRLNGSTTQTIISSGSIAVDTWYVIEVTYNTGTAQVTARAKVAEGSFGSSTSAVAPINAGGVDIVRLKYDASGGADAFWDCISASEPTYHNPTQTFTLTEGVKVGDVLGIYKVIYFTLTDGIKIGDIFSSTIARVFAILDGFKLGDIFSSFVDEITEWTGRTKPTTTFTNRTKPTTNYTDRTKPDTTWTKINHY